MMIFGVCTFDEMWLNLLQKHQIDLLLQEAVETK